MGWSKAGDTVFYFANSEDGSYEKIEQRNQLNSRVARCKGQTINSSSRLWWIEKLLLIPIDGYRKFAIWCILVPYLINIRRLAGNEAKYTIINLSKSNLQYNTCIDRYLVEGCSFHFGKYHPIVGINVAFIVAMLTIVF